jgi:hypothetical protein
MVTTMNFTKAGVKCDVATVKCCPILQFSFVIFFWSFGIIDASTIYWVPLKPVLGGIRELLHLFIIHHVQTQSNRVCNSHVNLLCFRGKIFFFMLNVSTAVIKKFYLILTFFLVKSKCYVFPYYDIIHTTCYVQL